MRMDAFLLPENFEKCKRIFSEFVHDTQGIAVSIDALLATIFGDMKRDAENLSFKTVDELNKIALTSLRKTFMKVRQEKVVAIDGYSGRNFAQFSLEYNAGDETLIEKAYLHTVIIPVSVIDPRGLSPKLMHTMSHIVLCVNHRTFPFIFASSYKSMNNRMFTIFQPIGTVGYDVPFEPGQSRLVIDIKRPSGALYSSVKNDNNMTGVKRNLLNSEYMDIHMDTPFRSCEFAIGDTIMVWQYTMIFEPSSKFKHVTAADVTTFNKFMNRSLGHEILHIQFDDDGRSSVIHIGQSHIDVLLSQNSELSMPAPCTNASLQPCIFAKVSTITI